MARRKVSPERVCNLRLANPSYTNKQIGQKCGITRERARRILKEAGLPTLRRVLCYFCKKYFPKGSWRRTTVINRKCVRVCFVCFKKRREERLKSQVVTLQCEVCLVFFPRGRYAVRAARKRGYRHIFCSKRCQGRWLAKRHGLGVSPAAILKRKAVAMAKYREIWAVHQETGFGCLRLSKLLNISENTASKALKTMRNLELSEVKS